uniref:Uncharacterized protein n=1 Tax=Globodera rostochiensis TaxID=31243 RepID=A0A914IAG0_GLORO
MLFPVLSTLKLAMLLHHGTPSGVGTEIGSNRASSCIVFWHDTVSQLKCCARMPPKSAEQTNRMLCHLHIEFHRKFRPETIVHAMDNANAKEANFEVIVERWNGSSLATLELFNALRALNVNVLELRPAESEVPIEMQNLGLFFPKLQKLTLSGPPVGAERGRRPSLVGATFLRDLPALKALKASNTNFGLGAEEAQWSASIERLHFENCSLGADELPRWVPKCRHVERISLTNCGLRTALQLAHLDSAVQIRAKNNQIGDLHRVSFKCTRLVELDLRGNEIGKLGVHTLARCQFMRFLDLSDNPVFELPDNVFQGCRRLKELRLDRLGLRSVRAELFLGLNALKSLSLSGNPLARIDPFTFLPARSIRALRLDNCSLAQIPLAVTQCCLLDSLSMDDNRFATRNSMPAPLLALLPRLAHFSFARNPLLQLPWALFLYEHHRAEVVLLEGIVDTLIQLPVWRLEPCTPYLWHFHLRNASSAELRRRMSAWNVLRMYRDGLAHCGQLYETIIEGIGIYKELRENNGCEATRRLRSVPAASKEAVGGCEAAPIKTSAGNRAVKRQRNRFYIQPTITIGTGSTVAPRAFDVNSADALDGCHYSSSSPNAFVKHQNGNKRTIPVVTSTEATKAFTATELGPTTSTSPIHLQLHSILSLSLGANLALLVILFLVLCWNAVRWAGKRRQMREEFDEI